MIRKLTRFLYSHTAHRKDHPRRQGVQVGGGPLRLTCGLCDLFSQLAVLCSRETGSSSGEPSRTRVFPCSTPLPRQLLSPQSPFFSPLLPPLLLTLLLTSAEEEKGRKPPRSNACRPTVEMCRNRAGPRGLPLCCMNARKIRRDCPMC